MGTISDGTNTVTFTRISGQPNALAEQVQDVTRPGIDGQAYRQIAKRADPFEIDVFGNEASESAIHSASLIMFGFQGKLVTLTDDRGRDFFNVMVLRVREIERFRMLNTTNGNLWALRMRARMQLTQ